MTYIGAQFYHRVTHIKGLRCFILTHEQDATDDLFGVVDSYHENCPQESRRGSACAPAGS